MFRISCILFAFALLVNLPHFKCDAIPPPLKVVAITECPVEPNDIQKGFELVVNMSEKGATGHLVTPFDIDDNVDFIAIVQTMIDGKWVDGEFNLQGGFCDTYEMFMPEVAKKIQDVFKLKGPCPMPAGRYELTDFEIAKEEVPLPQVPAGSHIRVKVEYTKDDKPITCRYFELKN